MARRGAPRAQVVPGDSWEKLVSVLTCQSDTRRTGKRENYASYASCPDIGFAKKKKKKTGIGNVSVVVGRPRQSLRHSE